MISLIEPPGVVASTTPGFIFSRGKTLFSVASRAKIGHNPPAVHLINDHMDVEKTITEIELLERIYSLPDTRGLQLADREAANQKHDRMYAANPWFRLWQHYGIPR